MREQSFFQPGQEYQRELQPLGRVQAHQLHAILPGVGLTLARLQRGVGEEGRQRIEAIGLVVFESARGRNEFRQVLDARLALLTLFLFIMFHQATGLNHVLDLLAERQRRAGRRHLLDQLAKTEQALRRARRQGLLAQQGGRGLPHGLAAFAPRLAHGVERLVAEPAGRHVGHTVERRVVVARGHQPQVGERVLDLLALEKTQAAVHAIGHAGVDQRLFKQTRLGVGAVQHRRLGAQAAGGRPRLDLADHEARLFEVIVGGVELQGFALGAGGPQLLAKPAGVVRDDMIGGAQNSAGRTVVLFQADQACAGIVPLEL